MINLYLAYLEWCAEHLGELQHIMTHKEFEEIIYKNEEEESL